MSLDLPEAAGRRGRYAPSPTGPLHLGNVRTALVAWLQCRLVGGTFVLRMEDLDTPRTVEGSAEQILDDLRWLGLDWDEGPDVGGPYGPYTQSERHGIYARALEDLTERGLVYRCWCSRRDIAEASSAPHGRGLVYPGTCKALSAEEIAEVQVSRPERTPSWRFVVSDEEIVVRDEVLGELRQVLAVDVGDFVLRRADALFAYQLAVVVDDASMGITDVVRGADLLDSTPRQVALFRAFDAPVPRFLHVPLMLDDSGHRMSKRDGSESLQTLRRGDVRPADVVGSLAHGLGLAPTAAPLTTAELLGSLTEDTFLQTLRRASEEAGT